MIVAGIIMKAIHRQNILKSCINNPEANAILLLLQMLTIIFSVAFRNLQKRILEFSQIWIF